MSFASSFWGGNDYAAGLGVSFGKLQQGVQENQQMLTIARMRADAEDLYGSKSSDIEPATNRIDGGFQKDDGASTKKAYEGVRAEMIEAAKNHKKIASNIRELVVNPFGRWADAHAARVQHSQDDLQLRIKAHDRQAEVVRNYRSQYYNKCRRVEDLDEEEKLAFQDPQSEAANSPKPIAKPPTIKVAEPEDSDDEEPPVELGDETFMPDQVKKILTHMLNNISIGEAKVPILGTYQNVSTGSDITEYIQKHLGGTSVAYAERIGQDLIQNGFLRSIGNVGSTFANSSRMNYQWKPKVFQITGLPDKKKGLVRSSTTSSNDSMALGDNPMVGAVGEYLANWNPSNNAHPNETPADKLRREAQEADERYKAAVRKLDGLRCNLEESIVDNSKFMERCESDRSKAIKSVILDFSGAISNVIPSLQSTVDNMMLFQETVQPLGDSRYLLENYRTGSYVPRVQTYENYYNTVDEQTFGVDIEARAKSDRKRVPSIVTTILTFLDNHYPDLEGDEARRKIWLVDVPLAASHHLRNAINTGKSIPHEVLEKYEIPIVASVLKLYLSELPDSSVSSHVYEIIKTIYTTTAPNTSENARVSVIQSTSGQSRLANIATLDAVTTHFTRLIELTSADEEYVAASAANLAPCILRPKTETSLSMTERYNVRSVRDLLAHKDAIFGELKRASSLSHTSSGANRPRAISTDESRRREYMEERQRAIAEKSAHRARAPSPFRQSFGEPRVPTPVSGHRRDKSAGGAETRFPVNASPAASPITARQRGASLEVPSSPPVPQPQSQPPQSPPKTNGNANTAARREDQAQEPNTINVSKSRNRERSDTNGSVVMMSSSISNPAEFASYYNSTAPGADSQPGASQAQAQPDSQSQPDKRNSQGPQGQQVEVEKRNSLNRAARVGAARRKDTAGSARQSLVGKRDSTASARDSVGSVGTIGTAGGVGGAGVEMVQSPVDDERKGVELTDRPMDSD